MAPDSTKKIDMHFHVGLLGDEFGWGHISKFLQSQVGYEIFLAYARVPKSEVSDQRLRDAAIEAITNSTMDHVVCLALDPMYTEDGTPHPERSHLWVANEYVVDLRDKICDRVMFGASVHPYAPDFETRVQECVDRGAVLVKWLPSAQGINLAHPRVGKALQLLATAGPGGKPLPLLLHVGAEYAIPPTDPKGKSYDYLSWSGWDRFWNFFRSGKKRWYKPDLEAVHANLRAGLDAGGMVIFAHCGLPYFASGFFKRWAEHSDFKTVRKYLKQYLGDAAHPRQCYADVSACVTPFRQAYFPDIWKLPQGSLLVGSDYPVPVFELSADLEENLKDLGAILQGKIERAIVPQDNLLDVNWRELEHAFPGHPMFQNTAALFGGQV